MEVFFSLPDNPNDSTDESGDSSEDEVLDINSNECSEDEETFSVPSLAPCTSKRKRKVRKPYAGKRKKQKRSEVPEPDPKEDEDAAGSQWDMSSVVPPVPNDYGSAGSQRLSETSTALDAFALNFDDQVMEHIVDQTNFYAEQTHWKGRTGLTQD